MQFLSKYILLPFRIIWRVYFIIIFVLQLIIFFPLFYILLINENYHHLAFKVIRFYVKLFVLLTGIRYSVKKETELKKEITYIYCANHTSYFDIVVSYCIIPHFFLHMGKYELLKVPVFNIFFKKMNIPVDRVSRIGSHKSFIRAGEEIEKGNSLFLFPEGGILKQNTPQLHPFKNGPFKLAIEKQVPIVPITFLNNWKIFPHGSNVKKYGGPAIARSVIHKPVITTGMTEKDLNELREKVFSVIYNTLKENNIT